VFEEYSMADVTVEAAAKAGEDSERRFSRHCDLCVNVSDTGGSSSAVTCLESTLL